MDAEQPEQDNGLDKQIGKIANRKIKAMKNKESTWSGLGMFGMVGWSIVVPTLLGAALGIWLDKKYKEPFSWTLTCLVLGLFAGCLMAWHWISNENKDKQDE
jgi:ATP synthase protein I